MARTVAGTRPPSLVSRYIYRGRGACGMCTVLTTEGVRHDQCVRETNTTAPGRKDNVNWKCNCAEKGHQP